MIGRHRRDGVAHPPSWREPPAPIDIRSSPVTSTNDRHYFGTPSTVEKVSHEHTMAAASSLIRWSGTAAVLGACPPPSFLDFSRPCLHPTTGNSTSCARACFVPIVTLSTGTRPRERSNGCFTPTTATG